jgi:uncharacterized membrane protein
LESFSDIVMGFSLAQMSLNFIIPEHAADVYARPIALMAFLVTFTIVAATWYSHHWLFDYLFVPTTTTIMINFATLASLVWLVYQLQVYVHFAMSRESQSAVISYLLTFAVVWLLLAALYGTCLRLRWNALPEKERGSALFKTGRLATIGLAAAISTSVIWALHWSLESVFWIIFAAAVLYRIVARRWIGRTA